MNLKNYRNLFIVFFVLLILFFVGFINRQTAEPAPGQNTPPIPPKKVQLNVPYVSESPGGISGRDWINSCEEASLTMVDKFYAGKTSVSDSEAQDFMKMLFDKENTLYGSNANSDAARTAYLANQFTHSSASVRTNPTIDEIKHQLQAGHPVVSFHYGFALHNPNIPFLATGSSYHALVVVGYDDDRGEFIVNDDGDKVAGVNHRYKYDLFMSSLHDYDFADSKADGPARVLYTGPKAN